jgi:hypothetical protein
VTSAYPYGLIVNTDIQAMPGKHWCAIYSDVKGHVDFFDSYGMSPGENSAYIDRWINKRAKIMNFNKKKLQGENSNVCGLYCILFLRQRLLGFSFEHFIDTFDSTNLEANDEYVVQTVAKAYPQCFVNASAYNQSCTSFIKCTIAF